MLTIGGTYRWSVWHIYSITVNQVMTVTVTFSKWWLHLYKKEPLIAVASVLEASSNNEILIGATSSEISYHLRDIYSIYIYIYAAGMLLHINGKFTMGKLKSSLCRKVPFLTASHCLFRGVGQEMKQTYLYLLYPLFQAQCDRYDQQNYSVNGHHHYSGTWK